MSLSKERFDAYSALVLRELKSKGDEMYAPQLTDMTGIEPSQLRRTLVEMEARGMVASREEGSGPKRRKWYRAVESGNARIARQGDCMP